MENVLENYEPEKRVRPTFLTVLCILTFLCSGWYLYSDISSYFMADQAALEVQKEAAKPSKNAGGEGAELEKSLKESMIKMFTADNIRKKSLSGIVTDVLCLIGAFLMWKLKRVGYYTYIVGTLIGVATPFILFGTENLLALGMSIFISFFGLLFVVLYGLNLKSMK